MDEGAKLLWSVVAVLITLVIREYLSSRKERDVPPAVPVAQQIAITSHQEHIDDGSDADKLAAWIEDRILHLLVVGHTGGGKTVLLHNLATFFVGKGHRVIVCGADVAPGMYPGCEVFGYGGDLDAIHGAIDMVHQEYDRREKRRGKGLQRDFSNEKLYLIIDEYDLVPSDENRQREEKIPNPTRSFRKVSDILRRGRKIDIHIIIGVQDGNVKTLGWEGSGKLREMFSYTISMLYSPTTGERSMTVRNPRTGEVDTIPTPVMQDPEKLIVIQEEEVSREVVVAPEPIKTGIARPRILMQEVAQAIPAIPPGSVPEEPVMEIVEISTEISDPGEQKRFPQQKTASGSGISADIPFPRGLDNVDKSTILLLIAAELGKGTTPSKIPQMLPRYTGSKYKEYMPLVRAVQELMARKVEV